MWKFRKRHFWRYWNWINIDVIRFTHLWFLARGFDWSAAVEHGLSLIFIRAFGLSLHSCIYGKTVGTRILRIRRGGTRIIAVFHSCIRGRLIIIKSPNQLIFKSSNQPNHSFISKSVSIRVAQHPRHQCANLQIPKEKSGQVTKSRRRNRDRSSNL